MSYSLRVVAPTRYAAVCEFAKKFDQEVLPKMQEHAKDRMAAVKNVQEAMDVLDREPSPGECVALSASGYIALDHEGKVTAVSVHCTAGIQTIPSAT